MPIANSHIEPVRRNGPRESRKETMNLHELEHITTKVLETIESVSDQVTSMESMTTYLEDGVENAAVVTLNRS